MRPNRCIALAVTALFVTAPQAQTLFKCVQEGKTVYQSEPCPSRASQSEIRAPGAPPAATPEPAPDAKAAPAAAAKTDAKRVPKDERDFIVDTVAAYTSCLEGEPGYAERLAAGFEGWRMRFSDNLDRFNQDPESTAALNARLAADRVKQQGDPAVAKSIRLELCALAANRLRPVPAPQ